MARILWAIYGQSNETGSSPMPEYAPISTADTGSTVTFTVTEAQASATKINDNIRVYGGAFAPATSSSLLVTAVTSNTITVDYSAYTGGEPEVIANQSGYIRSEYGLPNSGSFWSRVAENYTRATGDLVQVVEYGLGGTSFIANWAGIESGTGDAAVIATEGDGNFDPNSYLSLAVADLNLRTEDRNSITPYDEVWLSFQHGQADIAPSGSAPYSSTGGAGSTTDAIQATKYSEALQSMYNYTVNNVTVPLTKVMVGSTIPSASYGDNNAMDNVIEAGINEALPSMSGAVLGPMMHTLVANNWSVETYPHNGTMLDDHATLETQEFMAVAYGDYLGIGASSSPTLTTPYSIGTNNGPLFTIKTSDTLATIEGAGFFNDNAAYASLLKTGDVVLIEASNGTKLYNVTVDKTSRIITLSTGTAIA